MPKKAGAKDVLPRIRRELIKTLSNVDELGGGTGVVDRLTDAFIENPIAFLQAAGRYMPQEVHQEIEERVTLVANVSIPQHLQVPGSTQTTHLLEASSGQLDQESPQPVAGKSSSERNEKKQAVGA